MTIRKTIPALTLILTSVLVACTADSGGAATTTTTPDGRDTTSTTDAVTTTSTRATSSDPISPRDLEVVTCEDAPEEVAIVCETIDLVSEHYVDDVAPERLADAATLGLRTLDGADSDEPMVCAAPGESFVASCETAAGAADNSVEGAEAMVAGMAGYALDPNSAYLDNQALDLLEEEQEGQIEGIGALVSPEDETIPGDNKQCGVVSETCQILIVSTITGAPADQAGLERNDVLIAVDGEPIAGWTVDEVTAAVRGPAGTDVRLTLRRVAEDIDVTITREAVVIPVVESETIDDVGYVSLANFGENASSQFEQAVVDRLADGVDELVIDLRNNPGGFLTTAIDVTSLFLEEGDVVVTEGPEESTTYPVNGGAIVPDDMPVYLVVNKGSASASEVVAATMQERDRAVIVGESTFGKNTVQQRFSLSNEGALKLTIARWLTPGGLDFGGTGVEPDIEVEVAGLTPEELVAEIALS